MPEANNGAIDLIANGAEIAGAAVGGVLGFLAGGPIPAAGAGVAGVIIAKGAHKLLIDYASRHLSHREAIKVGAAAAFALAKIQERIANGEKPRDDGFFAEKSVGRSSAEEILEGVLQKSKNEHQENKIKLLGNFFANVTFSPDVSASEANHLLRVAESLSYRQMCLLAVLLFKTKMPEYQWREKDFREPDIPLSYEMISLLQELFDMCSLGLAARRNEHGGGFIALLGWSDINPNLMILTPIGTRLAILLGVATDDSLTDALGPAFDSVFEPHKEDN